MQLELDDAERDFYDCVVANTASNFDTYVKKGTVLNNYAHIFELLSRLRQAVDHPYLVLHGGVSDKVWHCVWAGTRARARTYAPHSTYKRTNQGTRTHARTHSLHAPSPDRQRGRDVQGQLRRV